MEKEKFENRISATELRTKASTVLGRVRHAHEVIVVESHGKPCAMIKPYDEDELKSTLVLSKRDTKIFLENLDNPPAPNAYLKKAMRKYIKRRS